MFTANWDGPQEIDDLLPRSRYLWGYSAVSGARDDKGVLIVNMRDDFRINELDGIRSTRFQKIIEMFGKADFKPDIKANIIEWLWVHYAIVAGTIGTALYAGGLDRLAADPEMQNLVIYAVREALAVLEKRGVDVRSFPDTRIFLDLPIEIAVGQFRKEVLLLPSFKRTQKASHFISDPEEMKCFYLDVLKTGEKMGVLMPYLSSMKSKIEAMHV